MNTPVAFDELEPFKLERYFAEHEFAAPYLLGSSDCESLTIRDLLKLEPTAERDFLSTWLGYTESVGSPELRAAISALYNHIGPADVLVHAGAEEAIYAFARAVLQRGDRVVVQIPCYQSLRSIASSQGCEVVPWTPHEAEGWHWSLGELRRLLAPGARAVIVNSPHNPTGAQFSADAFQAIVAMAQGRQAVLFSDEVYRFSEHDGRTLPAACDLSPSAVSLGVVSKSFGLAGLRIGWIATHNVAVREAMARYKDYLTICNAAPSEFLATLALRKREEILSRVRRLLQDNASLLGEWFGRHDNVFAWTRPAAGPVAFVRVRGGRSATELCARALTRGVMLVPSTQFDFGDAHVRFGFGRRNMAEALERLDQVL